MASSTPKKYWNNLPLNVLVEVLSYLNPNDRRNAANTCRSWSEALNTPLLWRCLGCTFRNSVGSSQVIPVPYCSGMNAVRVACHIAPWLRCLWIKGMMDFENWQFIPEDCFPIFTLLIKRFLEEVEIPQLDEFYLLGREDYRLLEENSMLDELVLTLAKFLRKQKQLKTFHLEWNLPSLHKTLILDALSAHTTLNNLFLDHCSRNVIPRNSTLMLKFMTAFPNLKSLHVILGELTDETLSLLAFRCHKLNLIRIFCNSSVFYLNRQESLESCIISPDVWKQVTYLSPQLRVAFLIHHECPYVSYLKMILPPEVPLVWLDYGELMQTVSGIEYFKIFSENLEVLQLDFICDFELEDIKASLLELVQLCPRLAQLDVRAKLPLNIVDDLCTLKAENKIGVQLLEIIFLDLTDEEEVVLALLQQNWQRNGNFQKLQMKSGSMIHWTSEDDANLQELANVDEDEIENEDF